VFSYSLADTSSEKQSEAEQLEAIYQLSGVDAHLSWVLSTVQQESVAGQNSCTNKDTVPQIDQTLKELLTLDALRSSFLAQLEERLSNEHRSVILDWANSPAGSKIHAAEADSLNYDEAKFNELLNTYKESDTHSAERVERIKNMLTDTGAAYFISAINTETSSLVSMSSVCSTDQEDIIRAQIAIEEERGAEALYRAFMRQELLVPSSVLYQKITDEEIDAYSEFAKSEAGKAYFAALIVGVRTILNERVNELTATLKAM